MFASWPGPLVARHLLESYFDACVYAAGMDYVDVCIEGFSMTQERMKVTPFIQIFSEALHIITIATTLAFTLWEHILVPFKPFPLDTLVCNP